MTCVCGSGAAVKSCCEPIVQGKKSAKTAEALMRSRYTAYTMREIDYILKTCDPDAPDDVDRAATETWAKKAEWQGLEVVETLDGGAKDDKGTVEFVARYKLKGDNLTHHERAEFRRIDDTWYYIDGAMVKQKTVHRDAPKVGRNEPCSCGSGKKFKKCCGLS